MIIADTDVLIDYLRGFGPVADRIELELERRLATTVVTAFELWSGSQGSSRQEQSVGTLLQAMDVIPLDPPSARAAAQIQAQLRAAGRTLPMADSLIAGICVERDAILLTRNRRHFEGIHRLSLGSVGESPG